MLERFFLIGFVFVVVLFLASPLPSRVRVFAVYFTGSLTKALAGYENPTGHLLGADAVLVKGA